MHILQSKKTAVYGEKGSAAPPHFLRSYFFFLFRYFAGPFLKFSMSSFEQK